MKNNIAKWVGHQGRPHALRLGTQSGQGSGVSPALLRDEGLQHLGPRALSLVEGEGLHLPLPGLSQPLPGPSPGAESLPSLDPRRLFSPPALGPADALRCLRVELLLLPPPATRQLRSPSVLLSACLFVQASVRRSWPRVFGGESREAQWAAWVSGP